MSEQETNPYGEIYAQWKFPRVVKHERGRWWYLWAGLVVVGLLTYAIISRNFLFVLIIILTTVIFLLLDKGDAEEGEIAITEDGVLIDDKLWPYEDLRDFWLIYDPPRAKRLYLNPRNTLRGQLSIPIEEQNPVAIRQALLTYLPEDSERDEESFTDFVSRIFKL